jgi:ATP-binding cassette subfamily B protein/subfamily B ATP-binding cassette protein MsbA
MGVQQKHGYRYTRLMPYIRRQWRALAVILLLTIVAAVVTALMPWPLKILVDYALGDAGVPPIIRSSLDDFSLSPSPLLLIMAAGVASLGLFVVNSALEVSLTWYWSAAGQRMVYDLAEDLFRRLQRLSLLFHSTHPVGDSLSRLTGDTWSVFSVAQALLITPAQSLFTLLTVGLIAWQMDPVLTLLSLIFSPVLAISAVFFGNHLRRRARRNREAQSSLMAFVHQTLTALPVVQAFGTELRNRHRFQHLSRDAITRSQRSVLLRNSYGLINGLTMTAGAAIVLYAGGQRVISGTLSVGSLLVFVAYMQSMQRAIESLLNTYGNLKSAEASADRVLEVLDCDQEVRDIPGAVVLPAHRRSDAGRIRLEHVSFGYQPGRAVLHDINLEVQPGETIALVGPTGGGKTTLVSLIPRFFDPWQGRVMLDGKDIRDIELASLRKQVSLVLQDPFLLPLTAAENIAYGRPEASREEIMAAAAAANADEFIQQLPDGYDTPLGECGATLSGGQKQRLAIARALLKDATILILDEPTSALDAETEALLLQALERLMHGRTTFIIAHRLSTIRNADRILVLDKGSVAEIGTHQELIAANGRYAQFHALQHPHLVDEVVA